MMGSVRRPSTLALRTLTLAAYSAVLAGDVTLYVDARARRPDRPHLAGLRRTVAVCDGRRRRRDGRRSRVRYRRVDSLRLFLVIVGNAAAAACRPAAAVGLLFHLHRGRAAGLRRRAAAQHRVLRRKRRADAAGHAGGLGRGGLCARSPSPPHAGELSCQSMTVPPGGEPSRTTTSGPITGRLTRRRRRRRCGSTAGWSGRTPSTTRRPSAASSVRSTRS